MLYPEQAARFPLPLVRGFIILFRYPCQPRPGIREHVDGHETKGRRRLPIGKAQLTMPPLPASSIMDMNIARTAQRFLFFPLANGRANDSGASNRSRSVCEPGG
ncbi:hypothetical protein PCASD_22900 [Puccinia coronata f. sp. avenae]|uniref:Uncharacterized protein n=1 Tax=Puccinia coronata f. sp. avenae TaxID=200324 RepID=A0A2N5U2Z1_9BASI|nr:hypothetical protein PCASD_22900 [Puccinia coronata f. sp. avenae]